MMEFSKVAAGMQVAYVELTGVAVTLVGNEATNTFCALFHDREDGATFGRLIASEVCCTIQMQTWSHSHILVCCMMSSCIQRATLPPLPGLDFTAVKHNG